MNKTYIKNKGTTTLISSIPGNDNYNKVDWNIDYDGKHANIEFDVNTNGKLKHASYQLNNDDLEDILNIPAFEMPLEERLLSDFPDSQKNFIPIKYSRTKKNKGFDEQLLRPLSFIKSKKLRTRRKKSLSKKSSRAPIGLWINRRSKK